MVDRQALTDRRLWVLAAGDALAFFLFAALGHEQHAESTDLGHIVGTAIPFIAGWLVMSPWAGAYRVPSRLQLRQLLQRTGFAWLCAWPVALLLRALILQRGIPLSFALVALIANAVFLGIWRTVFVLALARRASRP